MALIHSEEPLTVSLPVMAAPLPQRSPTPYANLSAALAQLPGLHAEALETARLANFLKSAVGGSAALTLLGAAALILAGGTNLGGEFTWSLLVLGAAVAMLQPYIRSTARAFDRAPLAETARDLRAVLFYAGFAWGAGAFLLLGADPVPIMGLCFAILPGAVLALLLRDRVASMAFVVPVTTLTAAAAILGPWSDLAVALAMLLIVQGSIVAALFPSTRARPGPSAGPSLPTRLSR